MISAINVKNYKFNIEVIKLELYVVRHGQTIVNAKGLINAINSII